jgi:hypothetical protein
LYLDTWAFSHFQQILLCFKIVIKIISQTQISHDFISTIFVCIKRFFKSICWPLSHQLTSNLYFYDRKFNVAKLYTFALALKEVFGMKLEKFRKFKIKIYGCWLLCCDVTSTLRINKTFQVAWTFIKTKNSLFAAKLYCMLSLDCIIRKTKFFPYLHIGVMWNIK